MMLQAIDKPQNFKYFFYTENILFLKLVGNSDAFLKTLSKNLKFLNFKKSLLINVIYYENHEYLPFQP